MVITNVRQYRIARAQLDRFEAAAQQVSTATMEPILQEALRDQALSQAEELRAEVEAYESVVGSNKLTLDIRSISQFAQALIQARVAAGMTQTELADQLGVSKQQVQRDEQTGYAQAGLERLEKIARVLSVRLSGQVTIEPSLQPLSPLPEGSGSVPSSVYTQRETVIATPGPTEQVTRP